MTIKAIGFDFFGTLVNANADADDCLTSMSNHLDSYGFSFNSDDFLEAYRDTVRGYRKIRYVDLKEVNNCVWLCDTLKRIGYDLESTDSEIISAVERYFSVWQLSLFPDVYEAVKRLSQEFKTGLVSNFTDSSFLLRSLKKFNLEGHLDSIIISDAVGWRKPHPKIFKFFLDSLSVKAEETLYIGDDLEADIKGARDVGITAVLIKRQPDKVNKLKVDVLPDFTINSLLEIDTLLATNIS